jgi:glycosyltransferase involved in cell wall biosynthesis
MTSGTLALDVTPMSAAARSALYFQAATPAPSGARRILLISYNFPPDPAVGGLRWQQMAVYFAERGWAVDVIARDFLRVEGLDTARLERLPPGTRIFSVPDREPLLAKIQKVVWRPIRRVVGHLKTPPNALALSPAEMQKQRGMRPLVRTYLAGMDVARGRNWAHAAARLACDLARSETYLAVVTSGPPHMVHEGGRLASAKTGLPHVVDMRDPWSLVHRLQESIASPLWLRLATYYERRVMNHATLVTLNTEATRDAMRKVYPQHAGKIDVVRNGSDNDPLPPPKRDKRFRLRFAGSIYLDRDPRTCFKAAKRLITELKLTPQQFLIEFVGQVYRYAGTPTLLIAQEEGIKDHVRVSGLVPRKQALEFLAGATMLLSLPQDSEFAVPAKIYEYVRFEAWMLVLATPGSATGQLLDGTDADVVDHADVDEITRVLRQRYDQFVSGERPLPIGRDGRFDRTLQAKKMMDLIIARCSPVTATSGVSASPSPSLRLERNTPF